MSPIVRPDGTAAAEPVQLLDGFGRPLAPSPPLPPPPAAEKPPPPRVDGAKVLDRPFDGGPAPAFCVRVMSADVGPDADGRLRSGEDGHRVGWMAVPGIVGTPKPGQFLYFLLGSGKDQMAVARARVLGSGPLLRFAETAPGEVIHPGPYLEWDGLTFEQIAPPIAVTVKTGRRARPLIKSAMRGVLQMPAAPS